MLSVGSERLQEEIEAAEAVAAAAAKAEMDANSSGQRRGRTQRKKNKKKSKSSVVKTEVIPGKKHSRVQMRKLKIHTFVDYHMQFLTVPFHSQKRCTIALILSMVSTDLFCTNF